MPRFDPDVVSKLQDYMQSGMNMFGQRVTLRRFVSASAGNPDQGIADKNYYKLRDIQMELRLLSLNELQVIGGQDLHGTFEYISLEKVARRDEVLYNGESYRMMSDPELEVIGKVLYYKGFIERAIVTGFYA